MKIAVYVNESGRVAGFCEKGTVRLYKKENGAWTQTAELPLAMHAGMGVADVRRALKTAAGYIDGCRIFIAGEVKGVPYSILEGLGYTIWKSSGPVEEQLEYVEREERAAMEAAKKPKPSPVSVGDVRDGYYRIDLAQVLASDSRLTSKRVLIPFMEKTAFQKLEIVCGHPPRWLGGECERLKCHADPEPLDAQGRQWKITVCPD